MPDAGELDLVFCFENGLRAYLRYVDAIREENFSLKAENARLKESVSFYENLNLKEDPAKMLKAVLAGMEVERRRTDK